MCPPAPSVLNVGQFFTDEEVEGAWEVAHRRKWEARREALEIKASLLVQAFWHKTDVDLIIVSIKCCWEPAPRTLHHQKEEWPINHIISYLNELGVCVPTRDMVPNGVANHGSDSTCTHQSRVLQLLSGPSGGSQPCDASHTIPCYRRKGDLPVHHECPGV